MVYLIMIPRTAAFVGVFVQYQTLNSASFGLDVFELVGLVQKVVGVSLWNDPPLIWLLHEEFISLLLSKQYCLVFGFEVEMGTLH